MNASSNTSPPASDRTFFSSLEDISKVVDIGWPAFELLLVTIALFIHALLRVVGAPSSLPIAVTFTLIAGNWAAVFIGCAEPAFIKRAFHWNWIVYLPVLVVVGVTGSVLSYSVSFALWFPTGARFASELSKNIRLGTLITVMFGVVIFLVAEQRSRLERKNLELQRQVLIGEQETKTQAAELDHAREIQMHLLPRDTPQLPGVGVACAWQPATAVSGDYFDVFSLTDGRMAFCIADVSGKGVGAALVMANVQASLHAFARRSTGPAEVCRALNRALCEHIAPGKFVTLIYGILDPREGRFTFANAGHCLPIVIRADGRIEMPDSHSGVLGLFPEWEFVEQCVELRSKDCLLLVTDGLLEALNQDNEEFGCERLIAVVVDQRETGAYSLRRGILNEVSRFCDGVFQDDVSMIVVTAE